MTTDQLTPEQKAENDIFFHGSGGWTFEMAVATRRDNLWTTPAGFGWDGGYGTSAYTDPKEGLIGVLMTRRLMDSPEPPRVHRDFWTLAYGAIDERGARRPAGLASRRRTKDADVHGRSRAAVETIPRPGRWCYGEGAVRVLARHRTPSKPTGPWMARRDGGVSVG